MFDVNALANRVVGGLQNKAMGALNRATTIQLPKQLGQLGLPTSFNAADLINSVGGFGSLLGLAQKMGGGGRDTTTYVIPDIEPLQNLMFQVVITAPGIDFSSMGPEYIHGAHIKTPTLATLTQRQKGIFIAYPDKEDPASLTLDFYEDRQGNVLYMYNLWYSKVYNRSTGDYGVPGDYKGIVTVRIINESKGEESKIVFEGVFPKSIDGYNFSTKGDQIITPSITFSTDKISIS